MRARPLIWGYSWVGILNQLLLQWFFVRLQVAVDSKIEGMPIIGGSLIYPVWPLTGWWNDYEWVGRKRQRRLWGV